MSMLPVLLLLLGFGAEHHPTPRKVPMPVTLFTFDRADEADWLVVNDGVMGGRSQG